MIVPKFGILFYHLSVGTAKDSVATSFSLLRGRLPLLTLNLTLTITDISAGTGCAYEQYTRQEHPMENPEGKNSAVL